MLLLLFFGPGDSFWGCLAQKLADAVGSLGVGGAEIEVSGVVRCTDIKP